MCENEAKCRFYHIKNCRKNKEIKDDKKNGEELQKKIREKIEIENKEKLEKELKDKAEKDKETNKKGKGKDSSAQDFQDVTQKGPDIVAILTALQAKVEELSKNAQERKEREKLQSQYQMWYQYPQ